MVHTVIILLWDYKYWRGLSDDICLFRAPIPTSTFIRVVLCIPGMAVMISLGRILQLNESGGPIPVTSCAVKERLVIEQQ